MAKNGTGEQIFFLYDHNFLQSEEDDIKDAIKYFHPTSVLEDVQWALCGQLMGLVEFFKRFKSDDSPTKVFCLRYNKFAVHSVGQYSLVLGGSFSESDSVLQSQVDLMHRLFQFYHKSLPDVIQNTPTASQNMVLQGICDSFLALIRYYGDGLSTAFNAVPWLSLQKGSIDVQLHASYLLQCCQKTQGVFAGCLFFKNKLLFSQLDVSLVLPLLIIKTHQNNLPCQAITSESELHQGVRLVRIYLHGKQFKLLSSGNSRSKSKFSVSEKESKSPTQMVENRHPASEPITEEKGSEKDYQDIENTPSNFDSHEEPITVENKSFHSKSPELTVDDLMVETKKCAIDDLSEGLFRDQDVKLDSIEEESPESVLTLSELSTQNESNSVKKGKSLHFGSRQSGDENIDSKKKKTILKSKPKNAKALPKTLDIFKAVKLKLKESKPEEKLNSLMWNANNSNSDEFFTPATKPLSLIDLNTEETSPDTNAELRKTKSFGFRSSINKDSNFSSSQEGGKPSGKGLNNHRMASPKSASPCEISGQTLNIAERLKMSGTSPSLSASKSKPSKSDTPETSLLNRSAEASYLSDSTKSVILQKVVLEQRAAEKEFGQKNVSFHESCDSEPRLDMSQSDRNEKETRLQDETSADAEEEEEEELHECDLYIQSHSDILLLLYMEKDASKNSDNLKELWRNALPQLGNLDALVKECSEITELSGDQNYYFLTFNKVQKQLSGNMLWPITAPQSEFSDAVMNMQDEFRRHPDVHDITWRSYSYSTFGHQGPLRETFYQSQMPLPPTFSPLVERDSRLCLDTKAKKQLSDDHGITFL